jgi:hypothetical protein
MPGVLACLLDQGHARVDRDPGDLQICAPGNDPGFQETSGTVIRTRARETLHVQEK